MLRKHVHRVLVTRHGKLAGIATTMDMLRGMLRLSRPSAKRRGPTRSAVGDGSRHRGSA